MYDPIFNSVLVQIDDKDAEWGSGNDESMLGKSFQKGTVIRIGGLTPTGQLRAYDTDELDALAKDLDKLKGRKVLWNEGAESGTTFEFDGQQFGFIYWNDIRGVLSPCS
jgi:hypothetical protein